MHEPSTHGIFETCRASDNVRCGGLVQSSPHYFFVERNDVGGDGEVISWFFCCGRRGIYGFLGRWGGAGGRWEGFWLAVIVDLFFCCPRLGDSFWGGGSVPGGVGRRGKGGGFPKELGPIIRKVGSPTLGRSPSTVSRKITAIGGMNRYERKLGTRISGDNLAAPNILCFRPECGSGRGGEGESDCILLTRRERGGGGENILWRSVLWGLTRAYISLSVSKSAGWHEKALQRSLSEER